MACFALFARVLVVQKNFVTVHKKGCLLLLATILFFAFIAAGAFIFRCIEAPEETKMRERLLKIKPRYVAKYNIPGQAIDELYEDLTTEGIKGLPLKNFSSNWTFANSFLFAMSLVTTIGFGHLYPLTVAGKIFCMAYTSVGILLNLMVMSLYVNLLTFISNLYKANLFRRLGYQHPFCTRSLHFFSVMVFIIVGVFFIPGWVFYYLEYAWSYLDSIYFIFISLTTVGLGDFVPATVSVAKNELYRFLVTIFLWAGTVVVMYMMALIGDFYHNCNKGYHIIPVRVIPEKEPLMPENKSSYGAVAPITPEDKSSYGAIMPENKPYEDAVPIMSEDQPTYGAILPIMSEDQPTYGAILPIMSEDQPTYGDLMRENKSSYEAVVPMSEDQPLYGAVLPIMSENQPRYGDIVPIMPEDQISCGALVPIMPENKSPYEAIVPIKPEDQFSYGVIVPTIPENKSYEVRVPIMPENQLSYGAILPEDKPSYVAIAIPETTDETRLLLS